MFRISLTWIWWFSSSFWVCQLQFGHRAKACFEYFGMEMASAATVYELEASDLTGRSLCIGSIHISNLKWTLSLHTINSLADPSGAWGPNVQIATVFCKAVDIVWNWELQTWHVSRVHVSQCTYQISSKLVDFETFFDQIIVRFRSKTFNSASPLGQIGKSFWASDFKIELDLVPTMMKVYANFGASTVSRAWVMVLTNKQTDWGTNN